MSKVSPLFYFVLFRCFLVQTELVYWHVSSALLQLTSHLQKLKLEKVCQNCANTVLYFTKMFCPKQRSNIRVIL